MVDVGEENLIGLCVDYADVTSTRLVPLDILIHPDEVDVEIVTADVDDVRGAVINQSKVNP